MDWARLTVGFKAWAPGLLLPLILVVALGLRLYGIGWDQGYGFHPDERSIYMRSDCMYRVLAEAPAYADCTRDHPEMEPGFPTGGAFFDAERSPLNPHWFPLGSIIIYLLVFSRFIIELFTDPKPLLHMAYVGRTISALADVAGIFLVYLLGKRIYSRRVGLLAAALVALAVIHIQLSHFYRPETILVFLLLASFWFMLQVMERRRLRDSILLGLFVGLAFAVKVSVLPLVLPLMLAYGFRLFATPEGEGRMPLREEVDRVLGHALLAAVVAGAAFIAITPYAIIDLPNFVGWIAREADIAQTAGLVPYTIQYIGSTPFLYELRQTSLWGLGLPLGIVAWGGLLFTIFKVTKKGPARRAELLFLAWVVPNFLLVASFEVKFLRYIFPIIPFLILMGSAMLFWMLDQARSLSRPSAGTTARAKRLIARYSPHAVIGVMAFVVGATTFYALSFERVYSRPHPALQVSRWINENVPQNSTIITDNHWDEGIPDIYSYQVKQIPIYESDNPLAKKTNTIAGLLSQGDYLVFYSNRTYGSVARVPERYPLSSRYYHLLFSGELGYRLEKAFTAYPKLLGVAFVDDTFTRAGIPEPEFLKDSRPAALSLNLGYADNDVITYDHPKVLLFRNVEGLPRAQLFDRLTEQLPKEVPELGLMLSPEQKAAQRQGGTWSEIIKRDSWTNKFPILAWLLLVEIIYLAALPLATFLFRPLPDRGIILARLLGILGVCYVAWLLASLGWMGFSRASVLTGILAVAFLSGLVLVTRWREFTEFLRRNWRLLAIGEVLFLVAFLSFVAIRMANPDLWHLYRGGDKPMDFAYLNAILRSTYMPPYDPWFAGGYLNYYYWGQFVVATLIKGTGIVPAVAYNLAVPLLFALTVTGAYSLVYNITAGIRRLSPAAGGPPSPIERESRDGVGPRLPLTSSHEGMEVPGQTVPDRSSRLSGHWGRWVHSLAWGPVAAGLVGGLFVAVIGNLDGIAQIVRGGWNNMFRGADFPSLDFISYFWRSSRMLPNLEDVTPSALIFWLPDKLTQNPDIGPHITEFPFFSFLLADLHAHMITIPFTLLVLGLAFSLLVGLKTASRWWLIPSTVALALALGSLWAINSWDYPSYAILVVILIGAGFYLRPGSPMARLGGFIVLASATVLLSVLAFLPFHMNFHPFPTGLDVSKWRTPIHFYLGIHGLFLFLSATFLIYISRSRLKELLASLVHLPSSVRDVPPSLLSRARGVSWTLLAGSVATVGAIYLAAAGYWTAALLSMVLMFTILAIKEVLSNRMYSAPYTVVPLVLIAFALLIGIGMEFVRVQDDIGRMNTLFKFYLEAWVLFGIGSAYILWYLGSEGLFRLRGMSLTRGVWLGMLAILLGASFIYPVLGTRSRLADRFSTQNMTLDGADYMRSTVHFEEDQPIELRWDYEAIRWLQDNVKGSPVVLEAQNDAHHWSSRIADYTGLPTVLGWTWHQTQQRMRYRDAVSGRVSVVREMYSTQDMKRALELLRVYEVEYVVVGQLERAYYPAQGLRKFDTMLQDGLARVVYQNEGIKIYQGMWYN